ncbi:HTH_Tnp_Tc3_2 domain-containing protein [Trichonephila clavipes]|nr:HTH_Tnp_Tc3_2 domain-containing protein [Trichonephila clavipes]
MRMQISGTKRQKRRGAYRHQCSCRVQNQQKCRFGSLKSVQNHRYSVRGWWWPPEDDNRRDDLYINLQVKRGRHQPASVIAQQLCTTTGRQVSWFTVARRLHKGGLFAHRPERCLPLKVDHRCHRLQLESIKTGQLTNGVVPSLWMRVGSVAEVILNAF